MKVLTTIFLLVFLTFSTALAQYEGIGTDSLTVKPNGTVIIDTFEDDPLGALPQEWWSRKVTVKPSENPKERAKYQYFIAKEDSNKFLKYSGMDAHHLNFPLRNRPNLNIYETPILTWQWRVKNLPAGGNAKDEDTNDTAASIYVAFDLGHVLWKDVPKTIRYTWSTELPEGTVLSKFLIIKKLLS